MSGGKELYQEYPEKNEEEVAQRLADYLRFTVVARKNFLSGATQRDVHGKSVAALKAEFTVDEKVPKKYQYGLFSDPGRSYPCWVRLSNSGQHPAKDYKPDIRGFAIKLMNVPGKKLLPEESSATTQDFLFLTTTYFFSKDTEQFFRLVKALNGNIFTFLWFGLTNPRAALAGLFGFRRFANLLEVQFWSTTPYGLGEPPEKPGEPWQLAVKYSVKPRVMDQSKIPDDPARNYLREAAAKTLAETEVWFDFYVQEQQSAFWNPIENGLVTWKVEPLWTRLPLWVRLALPKWLKRRLPPKAPLEKVASIRIPKQVVDTPERNWTAENLSMNVWHTLPEHQPLGNLNRARLVTYLDVAKFRRERNLLPPLEEPTAGPDFFADTSLAGESVEEVAP